MDYKTPQPNNEHNSYLLHFSGSFRHTYLLSKPPEEIENLGGELKQKEVDDEVHGLRLLSLLPPASRGA
jgi:hypothetical protein